MDSIHVAITRTVLPGEEERFQQKLLDFVQRSMAASGVTGVHVLHPLPDSGNREYGVLRSFENEASAEAFYASELFSQWVRDVEPLVVGEPVRRELTGLEAFFRLGSGSMPPRWKMAIVTFFGVLPSVLLWSNLLGPLAETMHWLLFAVVINLCVVITLTWAVMPILTWCFDSWLHREASVVLPAGRDPKRYGNQQHE